MILVTGIKEIDDKLKKLRDKEAAKIIKKVMRANQKEVLQVAKELAPEDTGALKDAIVLKSKNRKTNFQIFVRQNAIDGTDPYPFFVEYGTPRMAPKGYLRQAHEQTKEPKKEKTISEVKTELDKAIRSL